MTATNMDCEKSRNARAQRQLAACRSRVRTLISQLALAEETERWRIASGYHERVAQSLAMAKMAVERADAQSDVLSEVELHIESAIAETQSVIFELSPAAVVDRSLKRALKRLARHFERCYGLAVSLKGTCIDQHLTVSQGSFLYRAVQELLTNAVKHGRATAVEVILFADDHDVSVCVEDNGLGFRRNRRTGGGFGLRDIRLRAEGFGGSLRVMSLDRGGSTVGITLPITKSGD